MAPSATETTIAVTQLPLKLHSTTSGTGDYKQLQAHNVDRDAEEGRKEGIKAAKVRNPDHNHTAFSPSCLNTLILLPNTPRYLNCGGQVICSIVH
jgi:hypothetical protein